MPSYESLLFVIVPLILFGWLITIIYYRCKCSRIDYDEHQRGRIWFEAEEELKEEIKKQRRKEMIEQGVYIPEPVQVVIKHEDTATLNFLENMKQSTTEDSLKKIEESLKTIERNTLHSSDSPMNVWRNYKK